MACSMRQIRTLSVADDQLKSHLYARSKCVCNEKWSDFNTSKATLLELWSHFTSVNLGFTGRKPVHYDHNSGTYDS